MSNHMKKSEAYLYPTMEDIVETVARLSGKVLRTPAWQWQTGIVGEVLSESTEVWLKLELFQKTGTFKLRGALSCIDALTVKDCYKRKNAPDRMSVHGERDMWQGKRSNSGA